jgi:hypothetical protein
MLVKTIQSSNGEEVKYVKRFIGNGGVIVHQPWDGAGDKVNVP